MECEGDDLDYVRRPQTEPSAASKSESSEGESLYSGSEAYYLELVNLPSANQVGQCSDNDDDYDREDDEIG
eukprot:3028132-Karenia_brevis.AAC.1